MHIRKMVLCASFAALMSISAWVCVPIPGVRFTMQTFALFLALIMQGGRWGTVSVVLYLLLGAVGMPVFSGFQGGVGVLFGPTGGYIWGFLGAALVYWCTHRLWMKPVLSCMLGLLACYMVGTVWFAFAYSNGMGLGGILLACVVPYILPDMGKMVLALFLSRRIGRYTV